MSLHSALARPNGGSGGLGPQLEIFPLAGGGLRVVGEIDLCVDDLWAAALEQVPAGGTEIRIDLTELRFMSTRALSMLVNASQQLPTGARMVLINPNGLVRRMIGVLWPHGVPRLTLDTEQP